MRLVIFLNGRENRAVSAVVYKYGCVIYITHKYILFAFKTFSNKKWFNMIGSVL